MRGAMFGQQFARMAEIVMAKRHHHAARQLRSGKEAGVRQLVDENQPARTDENRDDAGIGDDDVEPAEGLQSLLEHRCEGIAVANVALPGEDSAATVLDQLHCGGQVIRGCAGVVGRLELCADVDRDDGGTLGGEPDRVRAPHSACGPGDERNLTVE